MPFNINETSADEIVIHYVLDNMGKNKIVAKPVFQNLVRHNGFKLDHYKFAGLMIHYGLIEDVGTAYKITPKGHMVNSVGGFIKFNEDLKENDAQNKRHTKLEIRKLTMEVVWFKWLFIVTIISVVISLLSLLTDWQIFK